MYYLNLDVLIFELNISTDVQDKKGEKIIKRLKSMKWEYKNKKSKLDSYF